ncbi:response regulator [bacterium]|nr:response regulator [bacterium]
MKKVLVIDDEETTRSLITHLLKAQGYQIITATNGIEGIRKALSYHPDVMTVDVVMPKLNGINMMKILTLLQLQIPSIFVTVKSGIQKYVDSFPSIKNFCLKPNLRESLLGMVEEAINDDRGYTDITYALSEKEIFDLLGKSDRKKILVAADDETLDLVMVMLGDTDIYEIYHAPDGQEAIFKAVMLQPDLILSDIDLPSINGIMLAKILFILGHPFPILYMSDKTDIKTIQEASTLEGIKGYLLKAEVQATEVLLQQRVEEILGISEEEKEVLQASYKAADIDKIGDFENGSSIWVSLAP